MTEKPVAIACDHAGYALKEELKKYFERIGVAYTDYGTDGVCSVDYPEYAHRLCTALQQEKHELGVLVCGTGIGMCMAANKHRGIRAAVCSDTFSARMTRMHNNANVLCLGARVVGVGLAEDLVGVFLGTAFEGGRHQRRVEMLNNLDENGKSEER